MRLYFTWGKTGDVAPTTTGDKPCFGATLHFLKGFTWFSTGALLDTQNTHYEVDAGPGMGLVGRTTGERGDCEKSKSANRLPSCDAFSRTSGLGSGRPSVFGSMRCPLRKSSSMNLT